jgi:hypothetical protein
MPLLNPRFEEAGPEPGTAAHWTLVTFVAAERIAGFGPTPVRAWEDFERWSELHLGFASTDVAVGFFDPRPEGFEDFEEAWDNDHYLGELPTGQVVTCPFDGEAVEGLEHGWDNDGFVREWTAVIAVVGVFADEPHEAFEGAWLGNEAFLTAWADNAAEIAAFSSGGDVHESHEGFKASWPAARTI